MRETVKIRAVAGSLVVSLPQSVLEPVGLKEGDRVIVEAAPPRRLVITKEGKTMTSTQHLDMEIDLLEKKKTAIESDLRYKEHQYNNNIPCEPGLGDQDTAFAILMERVRDRDKLDVEIAEKRIELYNIQAGPVEIAPATEDSQMMKTDAPAPPKTERAWFYLEGKDGSAQFLSLVNAKGSCRLRRFDANTGKAVHKLETGIGDYRTVFYKELRSAKRFTVSEQPNLARDCKDALPSDILQELQKQIQPALTEA